MSFPVSWHRRRVDAKSGIFPKISNVLLQMLQPAYGALMVLRVSTPRSGSNFSAICLSWSKWLPKMAQMFL